MSIYHAAVNMQLSEKQEVVETAQEKVTGLKTLAKELERQLEEEREQRQNLVASWEQEMVELQAQVRVAKEHPLCQVEYILHASDSCFSSFTSIHFLVLSCSIDGEPCCVYVDV